MKTSRLIILIFVFILFSLLHVFVQTEIIKLGYKVKQNEDTMQRLVENNQVLRYNIYALESPYRLEQYIVKRKSDLKHLESLHVLSISSEREVQYASAREKLEQPLLDSFLLLPLKKFFTGKQAEAKQ